jgi:hypothetical protein
MKKLRVVLCCCAVAAVTSVQAQKNCSPGDAAAAQKAIDKIVSWPNLEKAFRDYGHCDSGPVEEAFTDALMRMLVGWKNIDAVAGATSKDAKYKEFVNKHLMSPAAKDDREDVYALAKKNCPSMQDKFCTELMDAIRPVGGAAKPGDAPMSFDAMKPIGK